ncbi:MAG: hypothetical protein APR63_11405 [Desulfuromonas sp. SDB]|nr:MAG: hypothetical protein APR63_11405 [Desulfuromonas sp. SDB]
MIERKKYIKIWKELSQDKSMIFISGPRQTGKTTLSRMISKDYKNNLYFNYDMILNKQKLVNDPLFFEKVDRKDNTTPLIIFDEIHKYSDFKNYLKGIIDQFSLNYKFLVLGSGRLDTYQKGSDSLAGRYFQFRLFPFTISEFSRNNSQIVDFLENPLNCINSDNSYPRWYDLAEYSGFPEPYLKATKEFFIRWSNTYHQQVIRDDILSMKELRKIDELEMLFSILPFKISSPLSLDSLARDIKVSFNAVKSWINIFESLFLVFRISPWTNKISRSLSKEKKLYLYNYAIINDPAKKFENMVALELYRATTNWNNLGYGTFSLHYIRNKEKQEVDFLISNNHKPILLIEVKLNDPHPPPSLIKFQDILNVPAIQLVNQKEIYRILTNKNNKILIITAPKWLSSLP